MLSYSLQLLFSYFLIFYWQQTQVFAPWILWLKVAWSALTPNSKIICITTQTLKYNWKWLLHELDILNITSWSTNTCPYASKHSLSCTFTTIIYVHFAVYVFSQVLSSKFLINHEVQVDIKGFSVASTISFEHILVEGPINTYCWKWMGLSLVVDLGVMGGTWSCSPPPKKKKNKIIAIQ